METIKNYLDTMFQNLPDTPEVQKAKSELLSMMEDKYTELMKEGHTENEAIGTVISEFGNLDELAEDLGIVNLIRPEAARSANESSENAYDLRKVLPVEDVTGYLEMQKHRAILIALGVFLCITCPVPAIASGLYNSASAETIGAIGLFIMIAVAVALFIISGIQAGRYDHLRQEDYTLETASAAAVTERRNRFRTPYAIILSLGIMLCILSPTPAIVLEEMSSRLNPDLVDTLSAVGLFLFVGLGVFLIVVSNITMNGYKDLLNLHDSTGHSSHNTGKRDGIHYTNPTVSAVMSVYWPTVTCIYLMWSFLTFNWHITWIIWPVTGILKKVIDTIWEDTQD
ncbi:MAG: hypothetical protein IJ147_00615 [Lachnospiraceae bacterium]|nr:hypothetical protein [Lachnospiraceae bacterium]